MSLPSRIAKHDGGKCILLEPVVWCPHMHRANLCSLLVSLCWHPPKWPIYKIAPWVGREGVVWISHIGLHNRAVFLVGRFQNSSHSWRNPFRTKHHPRSWGSEKPETSSRDFFIVLSGLFGAFEALRGWGKWLSTEEEAWKALLSIFWNNPSFLGQPRFLSERKQLLGEDKELPRGDSQNFKQPKWMDSNNQNRAQ